MDCTKNLLIQCLKLDDTSRAALHYSLQYYWQMIVIAEAGRATMIYIPVGPHFQHQFLIFMFVAVPITLLRTFLIH